MRIYLVRHGLSEGNEDETGEIYADKGDFGIGLAPVGWDQSIGLGRFLGQNVYRGRENWPTVYLSSYRRTRETFSGIKQGIGNALPGEPSLKDESRLIEKYFGALPLFNKIAKDNSGDYTDLEKQIAQFFLKVSKKLYENDPYKARTPFGDSNMDVMIAAKSFVDGTHLRDVLEGDDESLIVTHGKTIAEFVGQWMHIPTERRDLIPIPNNCDVIVIEGEPKNWRARKIYDGPSSQQVNENFLKGIEPLSVKDIPPVPPEVLARHPDPDDDDIQKLDI